MLPSQLCSPIVANFYPSGAQLGEIFPIMVRPGGMKFRPRQRVFFMGVFSAEAAKRHTVGPKSAAWSERIQPVQQSADDCRNPYEVDYSRVIHSASFRRLQGKTQILTSNDGDFHRTRMTHSLEVAQVAVGILKHLEATDEREDVRQMLPHPKLIEAISLLHDLGHPCGGHSAEVALNYCMRQDGGFEANGQTLRILSKLEIFTEEHGSNMTRRTLLGILKYPTPFSQAVDGPIPALKASPISGQLMLNQHEHEPPKCFMDTEQGVVDWILAPFSPDDKALIRANRAKSFDCTIMDIADDVSYAIHDCEDAVMTGLVSMEQMMEDIEPRLWEDFVRRMEEKNPTEYQDTTGTRYEAILSALFSGDPHTTKKVISRLVSYMLSNIYVAERPEFASKMYRFKAAMKPEAARLLEALKGFIFNRVIRSPQLQQIRVKTQTMIIQLFAYLDHDPRHLLPTPVYAQYRQANGPSAKRRVICDYIASMTDASLTQAYERLFSPRMGSSFDNL